MLLIFCLIIVFSTVRTLDNGLTLRPPMGWMSWGFYECNINCKANPETCLSENLIMSVADTFAADGFLDGGYEFIIIDDCWSEKERDGYGKLVADRYRFAHGIKFLADYVHSKGLKLGLYSNVGPKTCMGFAGSQAHFEIDAATFAEWGVDYFKMDGCFVPENTLNSAYTEFGRALNKTGRPIVYSCSWPYYIEFIFSKNANFDKIRETCNLWRNYHDIVFRKKHAWLHLRSIVHYYAENHERMTRYAGPGHWNDPDMLLLGTDAISNSEKRVQMAVWAMLSAPLLLSCDLRKLTDFDRSLLFNGELIAINQDPLGISAFAKFDSENIIVWVKTQKHTISNYYSKYSIAVVNSGTSDVDYLLDLSQYAIIQDNGPYKQNVDSYEVMDVWTGQFLRNVSSSQVLQLHLPARVVLTTVITADVTHIVEEQQTSQRQITQDDGQYREEHSEFDIRLSVPGDPGRDYPTLDSIPKTTFTCSGKDAGYYADPETSCQVFRVCTSGATFGYQSFLCPNGTLFNQQVFVCDWWMNVNCQEVEQYYKIGTGQKFENLRVNPKFMSDIRKMISYSMRNPLPQNIQSNMIMQVYRPPSGQLVMREAFTSVRHFQENNIPSQQLRVPYQDSSSTVSDNSFAASTQSPHYVNNNHAQIINAVRSQYAVNSKDADYTNGKLLNEGQIPFKNGNSKTYNGHASFSYSPISSAQGFSFSNSQTDEIFKEQSNRYLNMNLQYQTKQNLIQSMRPKNFKIQSQQINALYNSGQAARYTSNQNPQFSNAQSNGQSEVHYSNRNKFADAVPSNKQTALLLSGDQGRNTGYVIIKPNLVQNMQNLVSAPNYPKKPNSSYLPAKVVTKSARLTATKRPVPQKVMRNWMIQQPKPAPLTVLPTSLSPRTYLAPEPAIQKISQIKTPSTPAPRYLEPLYQNPGNTPITITKHSRINTNHNNLTFTDILTREKLDITVNKIVKDTSKVLNADSFGISENFERQRLPASDVPLPKFIPPQTSTNNYEKITTFNPSNIIAKNVVFHSESASTYSPIRQKNLTNNVQTVNSRIQIERENVRTSERIKDTVTIKINVPAEAAAYILKTRNDSEFERLEILHAGNSNFLVLTNTRQPDYMFKKFIPLGKLISYNLSDSKAYVQSLVDNTINAAKNYENTVNENFEQLKLVNTQTFGQEFKTLDQDEFQEITQRISELTNAHYTSTPQQNAYNTDAHSKNIFQTSAKYKIEKKPNAVVTIQSQRQTSTEPQRNESFYPPRLHPGPVPSSQQTARLEVEPISRPFSKVQQQNYGRQRISNQSSQTSTIRPIIINPSTTVNTELEDFSTPAISSSNTKKVNPIKESGEAEVFEPSTAAAPSFKPAKLQLAPELKNKPTNTIEPEFTDYEQNKDEKVITYKADKAYYIYSKQPGSYRTNGNLIHKSSAFTQAGSDRPSKIVTTFQFIPSIGFQLDDVEDQQKFLNVIQNQLADEEMYNRQGHYAHYNPEKIVQTNSGYSANRITDSNAADLVGYPRVNPNEVISNVEFDGYPKTKPNRVVADVGFTGYPRATPPAALYAGPSSYLAPQRSVSSLDSNRVVSGQPNIIPPQPTYVPAKLEVVDDDLSYPKVTPSIAFNY